MDKSAAAAALGSIKSEKKTAAARTNGRKGGRPLSPETLAERIYNTVYGDIDSKTHRSAVQTAILDWLKTGDLGDKPNVKTLAAEWKEYWSQADE